MKMISKVLVDTCFLIELAGKDKECHQSALDYFQYFNENNIEYYLSPIVAAEYWHNNLVADFPSTHFKHLTFNCIDGFQTGSIARVLKEKNGIVANGTDKHDIKDDYKLLAQLIVNNNIDCFITKDGNLITKYVEPLLDYFPALRNVMFIDIKSQPITSTFKPQIVIDFPE